MLVTKVMEKIDMELVSTVKKVEDSSFLDVIEEVFPELTYVNVKGNKYWRNDPCQAIFSLPSRSISAVSMLKIIEKSKRTGSVPDEINWQFVKGKLVVRAWWD